MIRAFRCEWTKLWRFRQALSVWGVMVGLTCLFVALFFGSAGETTTAPGPGRQATFLTLADLEKPEGLWVTLRVSSQMLSVVAFVLVAGSMSAEYSQGTLKVLLARDPVRLRLLAGKAAALLAFAGAGILLAGIAQAGVATLMAAVRGIDFGAWWTAANLEDALLLLLRLVGAACVWGLLGLMLAILLRSAPAAIGIGIGYTIIVESLLGLVLKDIHPYMPGQVLQAFVSAGQPAIGQASAADPLSLGSSALLGLGYAVAFVVVAAAVFHRRDVSG